MNWPVGVGGKGNEGVAGLVKQTPGAIGYVELIYALQNKIAYGSVQNKAGEFVKASLDSVTAAAAAAAKQMPADFRVSITNAPGDGVYPISSFTWLLLYENPKDKAQAKMMVDFMKWALDRRPEVRADLGYAPLPRSVVELEMAALEKVKVASDRASTDVAESASRRPRSSGSGRAPSRSLVIADRRRHRRSSWRGSRSLSIQKFGLAVLADRHLGSGRRRVRRAAVHLGHALLVGPRAADRDADRARHRDLHLRAVAAARCASRSSFLTELLAAIPSIVYGLWGIFVLVPLVRAIRARHARRG